MRRIPLIFALAATLTISAALQPGPASASTSSRISSLERTVRALAAQNRTLSGQVRTLQAQQTATNTALGSTMKATILLLGLTGCETNRVNVDFTFSGVTRTQTWFTGDAFGPNPAGGFNQCVTDALAVAPASRAIQTRSVAPTMDELVTRIVTIKTAAPSGR